MTDATSSALVAGRFARRRKARLGDDASHVLVVVRGGVVVAAIGCADLDPLLGCAGLAGAGLGADALCLVVEGVMPLVPENPVTGAPWQRGEADRLWREQDGAGRGWVSEVLIVAAAARRGGSAEEAWAFTSRDGSVTWRDDPLEVSGTGLSRALAARLARPAFARTRWRTRSTTGPEIR